MDKVFSDLLAQNIPVIEPFVAGKSYVPASKKVLDLADYKNMVEAVMRGWLTEGEYARKFEKKLSEFTKKSYISLTNSGSSANFLAIATTLSTCKVPPKVVTCATGFPTTINPAFQLGAEVLFVDADRTTLNASIWQVMEVLSREDVGGIILAHTLGFPFDEEVIAKKCAELGKWFISDCSDALGSTLRGQPVGMWADMSTYSFYPAHQLCAIEGGAVACNKEWVYKTINSLRDWGRDCICPTGKDNTCGKRFAGQFGELPVGYDHKYVYSRLGYNLKIDDIRAALGESQMDKLNKFTEVRRQNFLYILSGLIDLSEYISFVDIRDDCNPSPFGFPITIKEHRGFNAQRLCRYLENKKIGTRPVFGGNLLRQPAYQDLMIEHPWPLDDSDYIMNNTFWVGVHPAITKSMIDYVVDVFHDYFYLDYKGNNVDEKR